MRSRFRPTSAVLTSLAALAAAFAVSGCEDLVNSTEKTLQGTAAPLKEPELVNTSKMLTCCNNLMAKTSTKGLVESVCTEMVPQVSKVIETYQAAKANVNNNANLTAAAKAEAIAKIKAEAQTNLEPASYCLLSETIGKLGTYVLPADCEGNAAAGALPQGKTCEDAKKAITGG